MKKILVTGASGLIGSNLIKNLSSEYQVYAITHNNKISRADFSLNIDLSKPFDNSELPKGIDTIIHLAQSKHYKEFPKHSEDIFSVNIESTFRLLNYARETNVKNFILASSGGVYGNTHKVISDEPSLKIDNELGLSIGSKLCAEVLAEAYKDYMNIIILRFFYVYGKGQKDQMLIPRRIESIENEKKITLQGEEGLIINPIHISDAINAIRNAIKLNSSEKINIAGPDNISLKKIALTAAKFIGKKPIFASTEIKENNMLIGDIMKMKNLLFCPKIKFEQGIKKYLEKMK